MNLIFIYGPPAAGKLTVGQALADLLGYKLLHNHLTVNVLRELFPFEDPQLSIIRRKMQRKFRLELFDEASKAGVDFITTCATAGPQHFDFYRQTKAIVEGNGGRVLFVQLLPPKDTLLERVTHDSRKGTKIETREHLERLLQNEPELVQTFPDVPHLTIDNSNLSPKKVAQDIKEYYHL